MRLHLSGHEKTHNRPWFSYRLLFLAVVTLGVTLMATAQVRTWARGSFTLPTDVTWDKQEMEKGTYDFQVQGTEGPFFTVVATKEGTVKNFVGRKEWIQGGKGLEPRLVLHSDADQSYEVIEVQIPGPNYRVKFSCRHKKNKGQAPPEQVSIAFNKID